MTERDREKMVAYIVENCGYCDEETVENWDDSQVQGQYDLLQKAERIDNLEAELAELKKGGEEPTENLEVHPKPKNVTMEEWMNEQPEEVRNAFRFARQQQDAHKIQLIESIVENTRRQDDKEFLELLKTKDIPELEVLNSATHRPVNNDVPTFNFFGQAAPTAPRKATKLTPLPTADELMVEMGIAG